MLLKDTYFPKKSVKKYSSIEVVTWNILKIFQNVFCTKSHLPWKFYENPFSRFSEILLTGRQFSVTYCAPDVDDDAMTWNILIFLFRLVQDVERTVELPVIWDVIALIWRHINVNISARMRFESKIL